MHTENQRCSATSDKLTERARLAFFVAYLHSIQIIVQMAKLLNSDLALRTRFSLLEKKKRKRL
jgi:hypothetical protein